jgi:hypothetical protein
MGFPGQARGGQVARTGFVCLHGDQCDDDQLGVSLPFEQLQCFIFCFRCVVLFVMILNMDSLKVCAKSGILPMLGSWP